MNKCCSPFFIYLTSKSLQIMYFVHSYKLFIHSLSEWLSLTMQPLRYDYICVTERLAKKKRGKMLEFASFCSFYWIIHKNRSVMLLPYVMTSSSPGSPRSSGSSPLQAARMPTARTKQHNSAINKNNFFFMLPSKHGKPAYNMTGFIRNLINIRIIYLISW